MLFLGSALYSPSPGTPAPDKPRLTIVQLPFFSLMPLRFSAKTASSHAVRPPTQPRGDPRPLVYAVILIPFPVNLSPSSYDPAFGQGADASVKAKIINLIASVRTLMRIPLIAVNTLIIMYELVLG